MRTPGSRRARHQDRKTIDRRSRERCEFRFLFGFLLVSGVAFATLSRAESPSDLKTLAERAAYVERLTAESQAAKAEAELWALQHGMPMYDNDGCNTRELMGILDGRPVYYTTQNVRSATSLATDRVRDVPLWDLTGDGWAVGVWDAAGVRATHQEFVTADGQSRVKVRDSIVTSTRTPTYRLRCLRTQRPACSKSAVHGTMRLPPAG